MIDLVCLDVDGTLVGSSGTIAPESWRAAAAARARGVRLAICSGRPGFGLTRGFAERLDAAGWHIFQNGASVVHLPNGETRSHGLPLHVVPELIARSRAVERVLELYSDAEYAVESTGDRARRHACLLGIPFAPRPLESLAGRVVRAQWLVAREDADAVLAEPHHGLALSSSLSPVMPDTAFINVTPAGVDKAHAVRLVASAYDVPLERVMMVGDGANDAEAMRIVGHPVAMGNAEPEARAVARHVVAHVDRGGVGEALELAVALRTGSP